jgi:hypothetical protein
MPVSISGTNGVTFPDSSLQTAAASPYVLKNRLINSAMVIDQRNAGAATANTINDYTVDRWQVLQSVTGKLIAQQNAAAVTPPTGFTNYLGVTSQSNYSVLTGDYYMIIQRIEGYNIADLGWGTANAKTVTLSFQVYSSLTGTFGGALKNNAANRSYPFTYSIPTANTWTTISVTIAGDTSGTWEKTTSAGIQVQFGLGVGSTYSGTASAWAGANYVSATGATSVVGTNGATLYITGVQLEQNTSATPFERRLYNQELANCQRYYYRITGDGQTNQRIAIGFCNSTTQFLAYSQFPVKMRTYPSALEQSGTASDYVVATTGSTFTACNSVPTFNSSTTDFVITIFPVASGLTGGQGGNGRFATTSSYLAWSAEL